MGEDNIIMTKKTLAAFTLIELLVVVAIIGILGTLGTTSYVRALKNARDARRKSNVDDIASALDIYWAENNGGLPEEAKVVEKLTTGDKLLNEWPTDTVSGYNYYYHLTSSTPGANTYVVCANVELTVNANSKDNWGSSGPTDSAKFFCKRGP